MVERGAPFRPEAPAVAELAAGGLVCHRPSGRILALHVKDQDRWGFPKGHVEAKESVEVAARREITEETGLADLEFVQEVDEVHYRFYDPTRGFNVFKTVVYWEVITRETEVRLEPTFDGSCWSDPKQLLDLLTFETDRTAARRLIEDDRSRP